MARDVVIYGETMVYVKTQTASGNDFKGVFELGLSVDPIIISIKHNYLDVMVDDYGNKVPAEVLWMLSEANIKMTLVNWDDDVLKRCMRESMGGATTFGNMKGAGTPLGGMRPSSDVQNHYIGLNLSCPNAADVGPTGTDNIDLPEAWRFPNSFLSDMPYELPIGTERSLLKLNWRAIPYFSSLERKEEILSTNAGLFDNTLDS